MAAIGKISENNFLGFYFGVCCGGFTSFSPFREMRERVGGFAADCREALDLTLFMPIPVFPVVWSVLLMLFILVLRKKM